MIALILLRNSFMRILQIFKKVSGIGKFSSPQQCIAGEPEQQELACIGLDGPKVEQPVYLIMKHPDSVSELLADSRPA